MKIAKTQSTEGGDREKEQSEFHGIESIRGCLSFPYEGKDLSGRIQFSYYRELADHLLWNILNDAERSSEASGSSLLGRFQLLESCVERRTSTAEIVEKLNYCSMKLSF